MTRGFPLPRTCFGPNSKRKCQEPCITTGKGIGAAVCGCGWESPLVYGGEAGATLAWASHIAENLHNTQEQAA